MSQVNILQLLEQFFKMICVWMASTLSCHNRKYSQQSNMFWPLTASTLSCPTLMGYATVPSIFNALDRAFDSDSFIILIDNCCSACVTNELADFEGVPVQVQVMVKGVGGAIKLTHKGTIHWAIQDNQGVTRSST